jgi:hypothetical protein
MDTQMTSGGFRQVDDPAPDVRATVVDPDDDAGVGIETLDADASVER